LQITRFVTAQINEDDADDILRNASTVLQTNDGDDDVSCNLTLTRDGNLTTFTRGDGEIHTESDFRQVCSEPGYIHVVNLINKCDGEVNPSIIGCAKFLEECVVVVRFTPPGEPMTEGILWAHEYGHTLNLHHRGQSDAVMFPVVADDHRKIDEFEADVFLRFSQPAPAPFNEEFLFPPDVRDFVHERFIHGVPFEAARRFNTPEAVQTLAAMLQDQSEEEYWPNIAATLGMTGNSAALEHLSAFVQRGEGQLSPQAYRAKVGALIAVGYMLGQTGTTDAVNYLARGARPSSWHGLNWVSPFTPDARARDQQLAESAIMALGVSGDARALNTLNRFNRAPLSTMMEGAPPSEDREDFSKTIQEALEENRKVRTLGLERYARGQGQ
jgi:hypothetical protein